LRAIRGSRVSLLVVAVSGVAILGMSASVAHAVIARAQRTRRARRPLAARWLKDLGALGAEKSCSDASGGLYACPVSAFVCLIEVRLHLNDSHDLKGKRKTLHSLKAQLRQRFGASVAEVDGQDTWQRATLVCALVGVGDVGRRADELERFVEARCPDGCAFERDLLSLADIRG